MGGGQTQTTNSNQVSNQTPWEPAIPLLQRGLTDASNLYSAGIGSQIFQGQRNAGFSDDQSYGIQATRDQAAADNSGGIGTSFLQNNLGAYGISPTTQTGLGMLAGVPGVTAPGSVLAGAGLDQNGLTQGQNTGLAALAGVHGADLSRLTAFGDQLADPNNAVNRTADSFMSGARDLTTVPALQSLYQRALAPSSAEQNLSGVAAGANLDPTQNAIFQRFVQTSADNAEQAQKQAFAASGRYGSGAFSGAVAKAVNDTQSGLYANQYNTERQAQAAAAGQIDAARQAGTQMGLGIQGQIGNVESTNNSQRLAGAGLAQSQNAQRAAVEGQILGGQEYNSGLDLSKATTALGTFGQGASARLAGATTDAANSLNSQEFNSNLGLQKAQGYIGAGQQGLAAALQGAGMLPSVDALRYAPGNAMLQVGGLQQQQNQADLSAIRDYFNDTQTVPYQGLSQFMAYPTAVGSMGGTTVSQGTQQRTTPGPSALQVALGLGTAAMGLGTGGGSTVGGTALMGLFGSDERMKTDIREVGRLHDGQRVVSYRYGDDPRTQIGLLAGDVEKHVPDAVGPVGIGDLMGVDYAKATDRAAAMAPAASSTPSSTDEQAPGATVVMGGASDARTKEASADLGGGLLAALTGRRPSGDAPVGLAHALGLLIPQEPAPIEHGKAKPAPGKSDRAKPPTRGERRKAA